MFIPTLVRFVGGTAAVTATRITRFASLLLLVTVGLTAPAAAQTGASAVRLTQPWPASLRLRIDNPHQLPGRVEVLSQGTGQSLYSETYKAAAYGHRFDFDQLPTGRYTLLLRLGPDRYRYTVQVQGRGATATVAVRNMVTRQSENILALVGY